MYVWERKRGLFLGETRVWHSARDSKQVARNLALGPGREDQYGVETWESSCRMNRGGASVSQVLSLWVPLSKCSLYFKERNGINDAVSISFCFRFCWQGMCFVSLLLFSPEQHPLSSEDPAGQRLPFLGWAHGQLQSVPVKVRPETIVFRKDHPVFTAAAELEDWKPEALVQSSPALGESLPWDDIHTEERSIEG